MYGYYPCQGNVKLTILSRLSPGTPVSIWFDGSGFLKTFFQFLICNEVAFSGGSLGSGLTYIKVSDIRALKLGA